MSRSQGFGVLEGKNDKGLVLKGLLFVGLLRVVICAL